MSRDQGRVADHVVVLAGGAISQVLDRDAGDVLSEVDLRNAIQEDGIAAA